MRKSLTSIEIPSSVTLIGTGVLCNCISLTSIEIPSSVTSIGDVAIGCSSLTSIKVDNNNIAFNDGNGSNCIIKISTNTLILGCKNTVVPDSVTSIGNMAFYKCSDLTSIVIPDSVTSIGDDVFSECTGLTSIVIPDSVTSIGSWAFYDCTNLTYITFKGTKEQWNDIEKEDDWKDDSSIEEIICDNGTIYF